MRKVQVATLHWSSAAVPSRWKNRRHSSARHVHLHAVRDLHDEVVAFDLDDGAVDASGREHVLPHARLVYHGLVVALALAGQAVLAGWSDQECLRECCHSAFQNDVALGMPTPSCGHGTPARTQVGIRAGMLDEERKAENAERWLALDPDAARYPAKKNTTAVEQNFLQHL